MKTRHMVVCTEESQSEDKRFLKITLRTVLLCPAARGRRWIELTVEEQRAYVMRLLDALEVTDRDKRLKVARAILYLAQGVWAQYITASNRPFSQRTYCLRCD